MTHLLYDFFTDYWAAVLGFVLLACAGVFLIFYALHINGKEEAEVDGKPVPIKTLPLWNQLLRVCLPEIFAVVLISFSLFQLVPIVDFVVKSNSGDYQQVEGTIENMVQLHDDYRGHELYALSFTVNGMAFGELMNSFEPEIAQALTDGQAVLVQYGYIGGQLTIYRIYTAP